MNVLTVIENCVIHGSARRRSGAYVIDPSRFQLSVESVRRPGKTESDSTLEWRLYLRLDLNGAPVVEYEDPQFVPHVFCVEFADEEQDGYEKAMEMFHKIQEVLWSQGKNTTLTIDYDQYDRLLKLKVGDWKVFNFDRDETELADPAAVPVSRKLVERLEKVMPAIRLHLCAYSDGKREPKKCDCKYGATAPLHRGTEKNGCPEMREIEAMLSVMDDDDIKMFQERLKIKREVEREARKEKEAN